MQCMYIVLCALIFVMDIICVVEITVTVLTHKLPPSLSLFLSFSLSLSLSQRSDALEQLQRELEALKNRLRGEEENRQRDHDASQAAKDAIIDQLRRELHDAQARLNEAENKIVELTTSKAAEIVSQCNMTHLRSHLLKIFHLISFTRSTMHLFSVPTLYRITFGHVHISQ